MERIKRPFYVIAHNPNTVEEVKEFLNNGANGLEPDVVHANGQYYVTHNTHHSYEGVITLQEYLAELKKLITPIPQQLAILIFDLKDTNIDPNDLIKVVKENFSGGCCDNVAMLMTHGDNIQFVNQYNGKYENVGIGVDESNVHPAELEALYKAAGQKNYIYSDGITTFLQKAGIYDNITAAQRCRNLNEPDSYKLIYTWVLSLEGSMKKYLDTYIDGIFVDAKDVKKLLEIIETEPYKDAYYLAENGHNPFAAEPIPKYRLTIKTCDTLLAGTGADLLFTLRNEMGDELKSLPYTGKSLGALAMGETTYMHLEGCDLGNVSKMTIEMTTSGLTSKWLPESIVVESKWMNQPAKFIINGADMEEDWINKSRGPVTYRATN